MHWRNAFSVLSAALAVSAVIGMVLVNNVSAAAKPVAASVVLGAHAALFLAVPFVVWFATLPAVWTPRRKRIAIWVSTIVALITVIVLVMQWASLSGMTAAGITALTVVTFIVLLITDVVAGWVNNLMA